VAAGLLSHHTGYCLAGSIPMGSDVLAVHKSWEVTDPERIRMEEKQIPPAQTLHGMLLALESGAMELHLDLSFPDPFPCFQ
jgi:hypothetical protein